MKKFFEEPSIECLVLRTENIASNGGVIEGGMGDGSGDPTWQ